jgi:hypothetical protein
MMDGCTTQPLAWKDGTWGPDMKGEKPPAKPPPRIPRRGDGMHIRNEFVEGKDCARPESLDQMTQDGGRIVYEHHSGTSVANERRK